MFGTNTRRAVREFQQSLGLPADGYPTPALLDRAKGRVTGVDRAAAQNSSPVLGRAEIRRLQQALIRLGKMRGAADGETGPATRRAIEAFERSIRLEPTGRATAFILAEARKAVSSAPAPRKAKKRRR